MRYRPACLFALLALVLSAISFSVYAQDGEEGENRSRFVRFVERQISTPDRQIRLGQIEGALSSDVRIASITISDREGEWLRLEGIHMVWSRTALLRRRLQIASLEAERIAVLRAPLPTDGPSEPYEQRSFELPELPVSLNIEAVNVGRVDIASGVIGDATYALGVKGAASLQGGTLDTDLAIERLDAPGALTLAVAFSNETRQLDLDVNLSEPEDGVVANLLNIEGRPSVTFAIKGAGPLSGFDADIALTAADEDVLSGKTTISGTDGGGLNFQADVGGNLERLVPPLYRDLVDEGSRLMVDATRGDDGAISIAQASLRSGVASLEFSGALTAAGVPTALTLEGTFGAEDRTPIALPGGGGNATIASATISANLGGDSNDWTAEIALDGLATSALSADTATLSASGVAENLASADERQVTFEVDGNTSGLGGDSGLATALGERLTFAASGAWSAGAPVTVEAMRLETGNATIGFAGQIDPQKADGTYEVKTDDLAAFSGLAGRPLHGASDIRVMGAFAFSGETFDLSIDGTTQDLAIGLAPVDGLLAGRTTLAGAVSRSDAGPAFEGFAVENPQFSVHADGALSDAGPLTAAVVINDIGALSEPGSGRLTLDVEANGSLEDGTIAAKLSGGNDLRVGERRLTGLTGSFDGQMAAAGIGGQLALSASLGGVPVRGKATLATAEDGGRAINDLELTAGSATLAGQLNELADGLYNGMVTLKAPDLSAIAPLAGIAASGGLDAQIALAPGEIGQSADISAEARNLSLPDIAGGLSLASAKVAMAAQDLFARPSLSGNATATEIAMAGFVLPQAELEASRAEDTTDVTLTADLPGGTLTAQGSLAAPPGGGTTVVLRKLDLTGPEVDAHLAEAVTLALSDGAVSGAQGRLTIGDGELAISGSLGDALAASLRFADVPIAIADAFLPDLSAQGTLSGTMEASGTPDAPEAEFDLAAEGVSVALFDIAGLDPIGLKAAGRYSDLSLTIDASAEVAGRMITLAGTIAETLDVTLGVDAFPLSVANAAMPDLGLEGTLSAKLTATGTLDAPQASFALSGQAISVAPLREAGLPAVGLDVEGRVKDLTAIITSASIDIGEGRVTAAGRIGEEIDINLGLEALPLALAAAVLPVEPTGTISGTATATGPLMAPQATFDLHGEGIGVPGLTEAEIPPLSFRASGTYEDLAATLGDTWIEIGGGRIALEGMAGLDLDLRAVVTDLPLSLAGAFLPDTGLEGTISGTAEATGLAFDPEAAFALASAGITSPALREADLGEVALTINGSYAGGLLSLTEAKVDAGEGSLAVTGSFGEALDLSAKATAFPLAVADIAQPALKLRGNLSGRATVTGALPALDAAFDIKAADVQLAPLEEQGLPALAATAKGTITPDTAAIENILLQIGEGSLQLAGTIDETIDLTATLTDIPAALANAAQPDLDLAGNISGDLRATGPRADPSISFTLSGTSIGGAPLRGLPFLSGPGAAAPSPPR